MIGSYNNYHLSPNGIPSGNRRWYGLVYLVYKNAGLPRARLRKQESSLRYSIRQGNLLGEHLHKVKRIMGMLHRSPRRLLWSIGGLPEQLKA